MIESAYNKLPLLASNVGAKLLVVEDPGIWPLSFNPHTYTFLPKIYPIVLLEPSAIRLTPIGQSI